MSGICKISRAGGHDIVQRGLIDAVLIRAFTKLDDSGAAVARCAICGDYSSHTTGLDLEMHQEVYSLKI